MPSAMSSASCPPLHTLCGRHNQKPSTGANAPMNMLPRMLPQGGNDTQSAARPALSWHQRTCAPPPAPVVPAQGVGGVWLAQHVSHAAALHVLHGQHDQVVLLDGEESTAGVGKHGEVSGKGTTRVRMHARPAGEPTGCCRQAGADCMRQGGAKARPMLCPAQALTSTDMP